MKSAPWLILVAVVALDSAAIKASKLPATFKLCKRNDPNINACLQTAIQQAIKELKPGLPALHLLPVDPLHVTKIAIEEGAGTPVNMNIQFHNISAIGLSQGVITAVRVDNQDDQLQQDNHLPRWYSVLLENLPEDGPEGPKHVGVKKHKNREH